MKGRYLSSCVLVWLLAGTANTQSSVGSSRHCSNPVPGLDKMSHGIDITTFDILSTSHEGLKRPVIEFTCDQSRMETVNGVDYDLPDQIRSVTDLPGGMANTMNTLVKSYSEARQTVAANFGVSGNFFKFGFSASMSLQRMQNSIGNQSRVLSVVSAHESSRQAHMVSYHRLHADSDLKHYVDNELASDFDPAGDPTSAETYRDLISYYGTHFFESANFGGMLVVETQTAEDYLQNHSELEVSAQAEASFFSILSVSGGASYQNVAVDSGFTEMSSKSIRYFGGTANLLAEGGLQAWQPTVNHAPWLFKGHLVPITRLIRDRTKKRALDRAVEDYMLRSSLEEMSRLLSARTVNPSLLALRERVETLKTYPLLNVSLVQPLMDQLMLRGPVLGSQYVGQARCEEGWVAFQSSCYKVYRLGNHGVHWADAQNACLSMGAQLVSITSESENDFVAKLLRDSSTWATWLALTDVQREGEFVWTNGQPVTYTKWRTGEPNIYSQWEDCVFVRSDSEWYDSICDTPTPYVCKK